MRTPITSSLVFILLGCGGPTNRYAETPTAKTPRPQAEAPAGSTSDAERTQFINEFDDIRYSRDAIREANQEAANPPPPPPPGAQPPPDAPPGMSPPPKKVGPAEQAPKPPRP